MEKSKKLTGHERRSSSKKKDGQATHVYITFFDDSSKNGVLNSSTRKTDNFVEQNKQKSAESPNVRREEAVTKCLNDKIDDISSYENTRSSLDKNSKGPSCFFDDIDGSKRKRRSVKLSPSKHKFDQNSTKNPDILLSQDSNVKDHRTMNKPNEHLLGGMHPSKYVKKPILSSKLRYPFEICKHDKDDVFSVEYTLQKDNSVQRQSRRSKSAQYFSSKENPESKNELFSPLNLSLDAKRGKLNSKEILISFNVNGFEDGFELSDVIVKEFRPSSKDMKSRISRKINLRKHKTDNLSSIASPALSSQYKEKAIHANCLQDDAKRVPMKIKRSNNDATLEDSDKNVLNFKNVDDSTKVFADLHHDQTFTRHDKRDIFDNGENNSTSEKLEPDQKIEMLKKLPAHSDDEIIASMNNVEKLKDSSKFKNDKTVEVSALPSEMVFKTAKFSDNEVVPSSNDEIKEDQSRMPSVFRNFKFEVYSPDNSKTMSHSVSTIDSENTKYDDLHKVQSDAKKYEMDKAVSHLKTVVFNSLGTETNDKHVLKNEQDFNPVTQEGENTVSRQDHDKSSPHNLTNQTKFSNDVERNDNLDIENHTSTSVYSENVKNSQDSYLCRTKNKLETFKTKKDVFPKVSNNFIERENSVNVAYEQTFKSKNSTDNRIGEADHVTTKTEISKTKDDDTSDKAGEECSPEFESESETYEESDEKQKTANKVHKKFPLSKSIETAPTNTADKCSPINNKSQPNVNISVVSSPREVRQDTKSSSSKVIIANELQQLVKAVEKIAFINEEKQKLLNMNHVESNAAASKKRHKRKNQDKLSESSDDSQSSGKKRSTLTVPDYLKKSLIGTETKSREKKRPPRTTEFSFDAAHADKGAGFDVKPVKSTKSKEQHCKRSRSSRHRRHRRRSYDDDNDDYYSDREDDDEDSYDDDYDDDDDDDDYYDSSRGGRRRHEYDEDDDRSRSRRRR